jgi:hypothetical protein
MFGLGTLGLFVGVFRGPGNADPPEGMKWAFLAALIVGTGFIWWDCVRLKMVRLDGSAIYVSNYSMEVRVPFDGIRDVTENQWINIHPITIHFHTTTPFGEHIVFMPKIRFIYWNFYPVVGELRLLAQV